MIFLGPHSVNAMGQNLNPVLFDAYNSTCSPANRSMPQLCWFIIFISKALTEIGIPKEKCESFLFGNMTKHQTRADDRPNGGWKDRQRLLLQAARNRYHFVIKSTSDGWIWVFFARKRRVYFSKKRNKYLLIIYPIHLIVRHYAWASTYIALASLHHKSKK